MKEASYKPVFYVPRADADMSLLTPTDHHTHCPYKGDASYFSIASMVAAPKMRCGVTSSRIPAMAEIKDYLAFYPNRVDEIEEVDALLSAIVGL